jgi:uncharacterized membrane protein YqjE
MVHQAKVADRNGATGGASQGLARDVSAFANDVLTLAELQSRLLAADLQECSRRGLVPGLVLIVGLTLSLACIPIAMVTIALGLNQFLEISHFTAFLFVAAGGAIGGVLLCAVGWMYVRQRASVLRRSRDEFVRNLRWIKRVVARNRPS